VAALAAYERSLVKRSYDSDMSLLSACRQTGGMDASS
jgi:hypothetical protein